jgi:NTE family protein
LGTSEGASHRRFGADKGRTELQSYLLGLRISSELFGAESGEARQVGVAVERTSVVLESVGTSCNEGRSIPRPRLATLGYGKSVELGFLAPGGLDSQTEEAEAAAQAARLVATAIRSRATSMATLVDLLGADGVGAFEALLESFSEELEPDAELQWHARDSEPVAITAAEARALLLSIRSPRAAKRRRSRRRGADVGLVLMSSGARGAYEAGALSVLLPVLESRGERPRVLVGAGTGAINAAALAGLADRSAQETTQHLLEVWRQLPSTGPGLVPLLSPGALWTYAKQAVGGTARLLGIPGNDPPLGFVAPHELEHFVNATISFEQIERNVQSGDVGALGVIALSMNSSKSVVFTKSSAPLAPPDRLDAIDYVPATVAPSHLLASSALPFFYPPIRVDQPHSARGWYVHGGIRLTQPLAPVTALGASRTVVISTAPSLASSWEPEASQGQPTYPDTLSLLSQSAAERLVDDAVRSAIEGRRMPCCIVAPKVRGELGRITSEVVRSRYSGPGAIVRSPRHAVLAAAFGSNGPRNGELMSNVLFAPETIERMIQLGMRDGERVLSSADIWQVED